MVPAAGNSWVGRIRAKIAHMAQLPAFPGGAVTWSFETLAYVPHIANIIKEKVGGGLILETGRGKGLGGLLGLLGLRLGLLLAGAAGMKSMVAPRRRRRLVVLLPMLGGVPLEGRRQAGSLLLQ